MQPADGSSIISSSQPLFQTTGRKRGQVGSQMFETKMPKMDPTSSSTFVPAFTFSEPTVTITNLPITDPRIPTLVESIGRQTASLDSSGGHSSLQSPQRNLGSHDCESNQEHFNAHSPATGLSQLQINSPQALSPNPRMLLSSSSSSPQRTASPVLPPNCPPSSPFMPTSPNFQRIHHNQEQNQQALNEQNINDFIKSILAPDSPGLSDLGGNIFFDGSTLRKESRVCSDSAVSEPNPQVEKKESSKEGDETRDKNLVVCREEESNEWLHSEKEEITESLKKLDIAH